ncbi:MAG: helix-turn-helix transcriptional regulator [Eubacterium sp.]|nr:helix-turn-helix transcriptional regulator [Eubacterium sp.]MBQ8980882.1 helix-turn-helix transcriptional regulator [Eubacterium sp.]MBR1531840.1 helix-turn-helix transcriptional regulator [Eubacterium sp.]
MFSKRLTELREFSNPHLRQQDVGEATGMSQRKISRLETGDVQPTPDEIVKLCIFYNVSADYLLGLTDQYRDCPYNKRG